MKHSRLLVFCIFTLVIICTIGYGQVQSGELAPVQMGAAKVNITPGVPLPMSGYDARETPFTGIHDQLFATALYFRSSENSLLLITADVIGYAREFIDETREMISARIGIAPENIMIAAVHTPEQRKTELRY